MARCTFRNRYASRSPRQTFSRHDGGRRAQRSPPANPTTPTDSATAAPTDRPRPSPKDRPQEPRQALAKLMQFARADVTEVPGIDGLLPGPAGDIPYRLYAPANATTEPLQGFL